MITVDQAVVACRFLQAAPALILWGALGYVAWLVPAGLAMPRPFAALRPIAIAIATVATFAMLPLRAAELYGSWADAVDLAHVSAVTLQSHAGRAGLVQLVIALMLAGTVRLRLGMTALAAGALLISVGVAGHAVSHDGLIGVAQRINAAVHVLAAGAWLGALIALLPVLIAVGQIDHRRDAVIALRRFSLAGHVAVASVLVTGIVNAGLILGHLPTDMNMPYQRWLLAKIAVVIAMVGIALFNRYALVPRMKQHAGAATRLMRLGTLAEIALGAVAVALVAAIGMADPA